MRTSSVRAPRFADLRRPRLTEIVYYLPCYLDSCSDVFRNLDITTWHRECCITHSSPPPPQCATSTLVCGPNSKEAVLQAHGAQQRLYCPHRVAQGKRSWIYLATGIPRGCTTYPIGDAFCGTQNPEQQSVILVFGGVPHDCDIFRRHHDLLEKLFFRTGITEVVPDRSYLSLPLL